MPAVGKGWRNEAVLVLLGILLAMAPLVLSGYSVVFTLTLLLYACYAQAWNLFSGLTGYLSLGHGVFVGIGAYTFALAILKGSLSWPVALLLGGGLAALCGYLASLAVMRVRLGVVYFAVIMLGLNQILLTLVANSKALGASYGFTLPAMSNPVLAYYVLLALAAALAACTAYIKRSRASLALGALLADEEAAEVAGVNVRGLKIALCTISAGFLGMTGGIVAWYWSYIDPYMVFDLIISFRMVLMTVFGGSGTLWGPLVGATVMTGLDEVLSTSLPNLHTILFGIVVVCIVLWLPGGLVQFGSRYWPAGRRASARISAVGRRG